jgi:hypothetical protein
MVLGSGSACTGRSTELDYSKAIAFILIFASSYARSESAAVNIWQQRDGASLSAGVFLANYSSKIQKSTSTTLGTRIDLEDDLGMDSDDKILRLTIAARPWPKHKFFLSYMDMGRDGDEVLSKDIEFDGVSFPIDTRVKTKLDLEMYRGGYTWSFLQNQEWELGLSLGLYWIDLDMQMESLDGQFRSEDSVSDPFPMIGFSGSWLVNEEWLIRAAAEAFKIDHNDTDGDFYNIRLAGEYALTESISLGAGYDLVRINAENTKKNNEIDYDYDGAVVFLRWLF